MIASAAILTGCASAQNVSVTPPSDGQRLVIYTAHKEEVYRPVIEEFEDQTGIWVDVQAGGTTQMLRRIRQEQSALASGTSGTIFPAGRIGIVLPRIIHRSKTISVLRSAPATVPGLLSPSFRLSSSITASLSRGKTRRAAGKIFWTANGADRSVLPILKNQVPASRYWKRSNL